MAEICHWENFQSYCLRVAKLAGQSLFELGLNAQVQHCQNESGLWGWSLLFVQNQAMMQPSPSKPNSSREVETHQNHQSGMPITPVVWFD